MSGVRDLEFEIAKRGVCNAVSGLGTISYALDTRDTVNRVTAAKVFQSFKEWVNLYEDRRKHSVQFPTTRAKIPGSSDRWSLAWTMCNAELYLKIGDLVEGVSQASSRNKMNPVFVSNLSNVRQARSVISQFLHDHADKIVNEATSPVYVADQAVIGSAIQTENLAEKFHLLFTDVATRINRDPVLDVSPFAELLIGDLRFHTIASNLDLRPIGLYPTLGKPTAING